MMSISIGIDVSKDFLEVNMKEKAFSIANNEESIREAFGLAKEPMRVILESTGKYHRLVHKVLCSLGYEVVLVNPLQTHHFAKALNVSCKTDKVDAQMLRRYGEVMPVLGSQALSELEEISQGLCRHLHDLRKTRVSYQLRQRDACGVVKKSLKVLLIALDSEIKAVEDELSRRLLEESELKKKIELLMSIPGIGKTTAIMLVCLLRELGSVSKNEIGALTGLAPRNQDSGLYEGRRRIRGGRCDVRAELYMPTVGAASRHNKRLQAMYTRLIEKGKPSKVALTACMRKLVIWANAILASGQPWDEERLHITT